MAPYDDAHFDTQARFITRIILPDKDNIASGAKVFEIIKKVLRFLQKDGFEVPFIYAHRKDYFAEVMDLRDLWRIYDLARQWWSVRNAKLRVEGVIRDLQSGVVGDVGMSLEEQSYLEEYLKVAEEIENINDVYEMLQTKYSDFIIMLEEKRSSGGGGVNSNEKVFKRPQRKKLYEEARKRGLGEVAARFGINIRGFVDALMNRQVDSHYPEDYPLSPLPYAENFLSADFSTPEAALDGNNRLRGLLKGDICIGWFLNKKLKYCF